MKRKDEEEEREGGRETEKVGELGGEEGIGAEEEGLPPAGAWVLGRGHAQRGLSRHGGGGGWRLG